MATLAAGAGWLVRDVNDEARATRNICQAYAATLETQFEEISDTISDDELARFLLLAPEIACGAKPESIGSRAAGPLCRPSRHPGADASSVSGDGAPALAMAGSRDSICSTSTISSGAKSCRNRAMTGWRRYFEWVRKYSDEYRDIAYTALVSLQADYPDLKMELATFRVCGGKKGALGRIALRPVARRALRLRDDHRDLHIASTVYDRADLPGQGRRPGAARGPALPRHSAYIGDACPDPATNRAP